MITADCGGSNGARVRLWKRELQALADQTGLRITVCHYPPGTSKWNRIEHRLFCHITQNWRAKPLDQPPGRGRTDRRHDHDDRSDGRVRAGHQHLSKRGSRSPPLRWPPSTLSAMPFTRNGTTPSHLGARLLIDAVIYACLLITRGHRECTRSCASRRQSPAPRGTLLSSAGQPLTPAIEIAC